MNRHDRDERPDCADGMTIETACDDARGSGAIIVDGRAERIAGACVVNFQDDPALDFASFPDSYEWQRPYVMSRRSEGAPVRDLEQARSVVDMVVLHADLTHNSSGCFRVLKARGFSTHFAIDGDGTIYQSADVVLKALHAGEVNNRSVGIDLNCLHTNYAARPPNDRAMRDCDAWAAAGPRRRKSETTWVNGVAWRTWGYTDAQYTALIALLRKLGELFPKLQLTVPLDARGEPIWTMLNGLDTANVGIYAHYHLTAQKFDPGPGFDWVRVQAGLSNEHNSFPVLLSPSQPNIPQLLMEETARCVAERYHVNAERPGTGGYYPIGVEGQWHGGMHLHVAQGTPVRAMFGGTVVAARNGPATALGSNNFVLLRHELEVAGGGAEPFVFYSLYMHLARFDARRDALYHRGEVRLRAGDAPPWVSRVRHGSSWRPEEEDVPVGAKRASDTLMDDEMSRCGTSDALAMRVDRHLKGLEEGHIAVFAFGKPEESVRVAPGAILGTVGFFGDIDCDEGGPGVVHIEVFADGSWRDRIDLLGEHGAWWWELDARPSRSLVADSQDLRDIFDVQERRARRGTQTVPTIRPRIPRDTIETFFDTSLRQAGAGELASRREALRSAISFHVSEWSDQVDWVAEVLEAQGWQTEGVSEEAWVEGVARLRERLSALGVERERRGKARARWRSGWLIDQIRPMLAFQWLRADVAAGIGLDVKSGWDGMLYHFHPIHFLLWVTFHTNKRVRVFSRGMSRQQLERQRRREQDAARRARALGQASEEHDHGEDAWDDYDPDVRTPRDALRPLWQVDRLPDEWPFVPPGAEPDDIP